METGAVGEIPHPCRIARLNHRATPTGYAGQRPRGPDLLLRVRSHNPDWAIIKTVDGMEKVYLVRETKGTVDSTKLRGTEAAKIAAARKHFAVLGVDYEVAAPDRWNVENAGTD